MGPNTHTNGYTIRTVAESKKSNGLLSNGLEGRLCDGQKYHSIMSSAEQFKSNSEFYL